MIPLNGFHRSAERPTQVGSVRSQRAGLISRRPNQSTAHLLSSRYSPPSRILQRFTVRRIKPEEKLFLRLRTLRDYGCLFTA